MDGPKSQAPTVEQRDWEIIAGSLRRLVGKLACSAEAHCQQTGEIISTTQLQELALASLLVFRLEVDAKNMAYLVQRNGPEGWK